jgi:hypothetical protein
MCLAGVAVQILRIVGRAILQVETLDITVLGQKIATIDPLALLKLRDAAESVGQLNTRLPLMFGLITLLLTIVGAAMFVVVGLLFSSVYNLLAPAVGGLEVELRERPAPER